MDEDWRTQKKREDGKTIMKFERKGEEKINSKLEKLNIWIQYV